MALWCGSTATGSQFLNEHYLSATYAEREKVKALGARWDPDVRKWYVPTGRDLSVFAQWLPCAGHELVPITGSQPDTPIHIAPTSATIAVAAQATGTAPTIAKRGVTLSVLLSGVSEAVSRAFSAGVWTMVEVVDTRLRNGHVYVEIAERSSEGVVLAKSNAVIWANTAARILPEFESATGATLGPGIKLLVRARPVFKAQYGFSIEIDAIDPEYTLGDLEAKKREIRARLQQEGVFDANRKLPPPWDFNFVLVVAPDGAAGLGDFQAEAERLERFGICRFVYATSRFQGEGAAAQIVAVLLAALDAFKSSTGASPDAIVIIRGGGAVNDLAWLNDYGLVRAVCGLKVPVLTGIGHERDSTVLDEVANTRFDTPSKVIAGIEQVIGKRAAEAKAFYEQIVLVAGRNIQTVRMVAEQADAAVRSGASRQLALATQASAALMAELRVASVRTTKDAAESSKAMFAEVRHAAGLQLSQASERVPTLMAEVSGAARQSVVQASDQSQALMREIAGQGPEKTLARGFAIVRDSAGATLTSAMDVPAGASLEIQFRDGQLVTTTADAKG
jgi:exodeoxyribonuclease VII large subunit